MRILLAVHHFPPQYTSGAEWEAFRIASHLQKRSHQVKVVCVEQMTNSDKAEITWKDEIYQEIPVRRLFVKMRISYGEFTRWEFDNPLIAENIQGLLSEYSPDVFHLVSGYLMTGSSLRKAQEMGVPTILSLMDFWFLCRRITLYRSDGKLSSPPILAEKCVQCIGEEKPYFNYLGKRFPKVMQRYWKGQKTHIQLFEERKRFLIETLNHVNIIISRSKFMREFYVKEGVDKDLFVLSRQGLDIEPFQEKESSERTPGKLRVGYSGQIASVKGVDVLIKAVRLVQNPNLELKIYGNLQAFPKYTEQLIQLAKGDDRIHFEGLFKHEKLVDVMNQLDVVVVPSVWYENSPNVIMEAFATRTPVIASDMGGMAELVHHKENGLLFKLGNAQDLADQLSLLLKDNSLLSQLRGHIKPVKRIETEMDELEKFYQSILK